jgi:hypothetical protein
LWGFLSQSVFCEFSAKEFFNSVGPGRWSGQSGKELVLIAAFLHPEMEQQAMEVGRSVSGGFRTPNNSVAPSFVRRAVVNSWCKPTDSDWKSTFDCAAWPLLAAQKASNREQETE